MSHLFQFWVTMLFRLNLKAATGLCRLRFDPEIMLEISQVVGQVEYQVRCETRRSLTNFIICGNTSQGVLGFWG